MTALCAAGDELSLRNKRQDGDFFPIEKGSRPVSRVLSGAIIPLGLTSP